MRRSNSISCGLILFTLLALLLTAALLLSLLSGCGNQAPAPAEATPAPAETPAPADAGVTGEETEPAFTIDVSSSRKLKPEETMILDVIVVYESVPAVFIADGSPDLDTAWNTGDVTILQAEGGT